MRSGELGPHDGMSALVKETRGSLCSVSPPCEQAAICKPGRGSLPKSNRADTVVSDF